MEYLATTLALLHQIVMSNETAEQCAVKATCPQLVRRTWEGKAAASNIVVTHYSIYSPSNPDHISELAVTVIFRPREFL